MPVNQNLPQIKVSFVPSEPVKDRNKINCSRDAVDILRQIWDKETIHLYEEFYALFLDRKNGIIGYRIMNRGSNCGTVVNVQLIFSIALQCNSSSIIICHNHPSGNTKPSTQDDNITRKIEKAAKFFELKLLDHIILTSQGYLSYMDEGRLNP